MKAQRTLASIVAMVALVLTACTPAAAPAPTAAPQQAGPTAAPAQPEAPTAAPAQSLEPIPPAGKTPVAQGSFFQTYPPPTSCEGCSEAAGLIDNDYTITYAYQDGSPGVVVAPLKEPVPTSNGRQIVGVVWSPLMAAKGNISDSAFVAIAPKASEGLLIAQEADGKPVEDPLSIGFGDVRQTAEAPRIQTTVYAGGVVFIVGDNLTRYWTYDDGKLWSFLLSPRANVPASTYDAMSDTIKTTVSELQKTDPPLLPVETSWPDYFPPCVPTNMVAIDYSNVIGELENPSSIAECKPAEGGEQCKADIVVAAVAPPKTANGTTPTGMCLGEKDSWINLSVVRVQKPLVLGTSTLPIGWYLVRAATDSTGQIDGLGLQDDGSYKLDTGPIVVVDGVSQETGRLAKPMQVPATFAAYLNAMGDQGYAEISACKIFSCCIFREKCKK